MTPYSRTRKQQPFNHFSWMNYTQYLSWNTIRNPTFYACSTNISDQNTNNIFAWYLEILKWIRRNQGSSFLMEILETHGNCWCLCDRPFESLSILNQKSEDYGDPKNVIITYHLAATAYYLPPTTYYGTK